MIQEIFLKEKANFAAKMAKNVESGLCPTAYFRHKNR
jgi:hypothetical protein